MGMGSSTHMGFTSVLWQGCGLTYAGFPMTVWGKGLTFAPAASAQTNSGTDLFQLPGGAKPSLLFLVELRSFPPKAEAHLGLGRGNFPSFPWSLLVFSFVH